MSIYRFKDSKVIDEVTFKKTERGAVRAYMHAAADMPPDTIRDILRDLRAGGMECIPFTLSGKPVVEVRGFRREAKLFTVLHKHEWVAGKADITPDVDDNIGWKDKLKKRSLQASGWLYAIGDAAFIGYGWKDSSKLDVAAGILYGLPTPVLIGYGRNDQSEIQIKDLAKEMAKHFKKQVDTLPADCSLDSLTRDHKKGLINSADELFKRFPSEFMNICYAGAGACIFAAAMKHLHLVGTSGAPKEAIESWLKHLKTIDPAATKTMAASMALKNTRAENYLNLGVGSFTMASGLFGALVKEKATDPDETKKAGIEGIVEWMHQHPLAITGAGFMVSTLLHASATAVAYHGHDNRHKQAVPLRATFVMSALLAELMVAISSKGHGEGVVSDNSVDQSVVSIAADIIVKQPKAMQNALIDHMGDFLGRPDVLAVKDQDATELLRKQVELLRANPWALAEKDEAPSATPPAAVAAIETPKTDIPNWQAKIAKPLAGGLQLQPSV